MRIGLNIAPLVCTEVITKLSLSLSKLKHTVVILESSSTKSTLRRQQENLQLITQANLDLIVYITLEALSQGDAEIRAAQTAAKLYARALASRFQQLNYKVSVAESTIYEILKVGKPAFNLVLNSDSNLSSLTPALPTLIAGAIFSVYYPF
jgi:ABC-type polar amino acid transport system ATPase subunit